MIVFERIKSFFITVFRKMTPKIGLFAVIGLSVIALVFQYFSRNDSVSVSSIAGAVIIPFQRGVNEIGAFLFRAEENRLNLEQAEERIRELEDERNSLKREVEEYQNLLIENKELRGLLSMRERLGSYEAKAATVIGNSGINVFSRFTVNLGAQDGIRVNMNVVNENGLIGIVSYVGLNYSIITSIIEDNNNVSAMTKNGHENCVVSGAMKSSGAGYLKLENALVSVDFTKDNTLVTSNISDRYLPNLLIGYVSDIATNPDGLTQSGRVETAVDFTKIKEVLIITTMKEKNEEVKQ